MRRLVAAAALARAAGGPAGIVAIAGDGADDAVEAIAAAGPGAVLLAPAGDDGPAAAVARLMGADVVRVDADAPLASWVAGVAAAAATDDAAFLRRVEGLASLAASGGARAGRPGVLMRWAGCRWRPCGACAGGGVPAGPCARCGARVGGPS